MRIDQVIPSLVGRDAIGLHTIEVRAVLRSAGFDSDIYYSTCTPDVAHEGYPVADLGSDSRDRWLLYQSSIGSPVADIFLDRPEPKIVNYHNITPASLLAPWEPDVAFEVDLGRRQLARMATSSRLAVADSTFNEGELLAAGFTTTTVVPLLIDFSARSADPDEATAERLRRARRRGGADLVFVGKVSPHKAQHDLVKAFAPHRRVHDPRARLHLVGSPLGERYIAALRRAIEELDLADAVEITGSVTSGELAAYYSVADAFVCASDHEGFCVPLVEAMASNLPIVAYGVAAVPETVGRAGLVIPTKDPLYLAAAIDRVVTDDPLRDALTKAGRKRVAELSIETSRRRFRDAVRATVEAAGHQPSR